MDLTDAQWAAIAPILPTPTLRKDRRGRPWRDPRDALNGVLWVLRTGAPWADMPARYPSYATCFRRFQAWTEAGIFAKILHRLAEDLLARGKLDLSETFIDGTHAGAKKGGALWAARVEASPPRSWQSQTAMVFLYLPLSLQVNVTKLAWFTPRSTRASSRKPRAASSATKRTTAPTSKRR